MSGHDFTLCRAIYATMRRNGCPPIIVHRLAPDFAIAQTKDGQARVHHKGCCAWSAKIACAELWREKEAVPPVITG